MSAMRIGKEYKYFIRDHEFRWCWACGNSGRRAPHNWHGPWFLQRAHLGSSSGAMLRRHDVKAVNILCPLCHDLHCNMKEKTINGQTFPCISNGNMIWLKGVMDPDRYDPEYIQKMWIGRPPDPEPLHDHFTDLYVSHTGDKAGR